MFIIIILALVAFLLGMGAEMRREAKHYFLPREDIVVIAKGRGGHDVWDGLSLESVMFILEERETVILTKNAEVVDEYAHRA